MRDEVKLLFRELAELSPDQRAHALAERHPGLLSAFSSFYGDPCWISPSLHSLFFFDVPTPRHQGFFRRRIRPFRLSRTTFIRCRRAASW